ncbi:MULTISPECIES: hypothetical protein [Bacillus]|uniref:hypothetical protein n=1 Tax=Bacillus TaxID=1386 RepID=UPI0007FD116D|nr:MULTISPECIES: hypothetical protein [Bacillus amyloliquefaciens group]ATC49395.1 hypothetical protein CLI97_00058 [Bacillus velezensis]OAZ62804.1 hypothetical protein SRCM100169_02027 [Bacillus siamensis]WNJ75464.1 hypothetical protein RNI18_00380 [Bacillus velezensis]
MRENRQELLKEIEIQILLKEIEELELALSKSDSNTVSVVLQEAIDKKHNEIVRLKPNG